VSIFLKVGKGPKEFSDIFGSYFTWGHVMPGTLHSIEQHVPDAQKPELYMTFKEYTGFKTRNVNDDYDPVRETRKETRTLRTL
jgi:hypothetical protein